MCYRSRIAWLLAWLPMLPRGQILRPDRQVILRTVSAWWAHARNVPVCFLCLLPFLLHDTLLSIAKRYGINHERFRQMVIRAKTEVIEAVRISSRNKKYSTEIKLKAVTEYLEGKCSQMEICAKYHITQDTVFRRWISVSVYSPHHKTKQPGR